MSEKILMKGNEAIAYGAIRCGCDGYFGYPITPQSEIMETLMELQPWESTGMVVLQAESETASINMLYGGAATGKKVMTSSSSPGISLMCEGLSYLAGAELPCLVVNVMRGGPGLGTIQPSQADYFQCVKGGGHGDYRMIVLAPASVQDMYDFVDKATKILPLLYLKASLLPKVESDDIYEPEYHVTEDMYETVRSGIAGLLEERDTYLDTFHQDMQYSDTPIAAFISENLADVYQDVGNFVALFREGNEVVMRESVALCYQNFCDYWGQQLLNALKALHNLRYADEDLKDGDDR